MQPGRGCLHFDFHQHTSRKSIKLKILKFRFTWYILINLLSPRFFLFHLTLIFLVLEATIGNYPNNPIVIKLCACLVSLINHRQHKCLAEGQALAEGQCLFCVCDSFFQWYVCMYVCMCVSVACHGRTVLPIELKISPLTPYYV